MIASFPLRFVCNRGHVDEQGDSLQESWDKEEGQEQRVKEFFDQVRESDEWCEECSHVGCCAL